MGLTDRLIRVERHLLVFEALPEPFHEQQGKGVASCNHTFKEREGVGSLLDFALR